MTESSQYCAESPKAAANEPQPTHTATWVIQGAIVRRWLAHLGSSAPYVTAMVISLAFLTFPRYSLFPDVESAWNSVLVYAHVHGLQFGKDIVYPYGPLGFLLIPTFTASTGGGRLCFDVLLCVTVSSALSLLAWRAKPGWRLLILGSFLLVVTNKPYGVQDLLIDFGLLAWGLLCFLEHGRRLSVYVVVFALLAAFSTLAKVTWLVSGTATLCALTIDLVLRKQQRAAVGLLACYTGGLLLFWAWGGQAFGNLASFLTTGLALCRDYDLTMSCAPRGSLFLPALCATILAAGLTLFRGAMAFDQEDGGNARVRRWVLTGWLLFMLFLGWKHGWVRADQHHNFLFVGFLVLFFLVLETLPLSVKSLRFYCQCVGGLGAGLALVLLQMSTQPGGLKWGSMFTQTARTIGTVVHPQKYLSGMQADLASQRKTMDLPGIKRTIGDAGIDVFGNFQTHAVLSGLNLQPRPVFQSYAVYNATLMKLNEDYYFGSRPPAYVLTTLEPIDNRFAALEDSFVFRDLLINYEPCAVEQGFVLMKQRTKERPRMTLVREGSIRAGEKIELAEFGADNLWMEFEPRISALGRVRGALYQLPALRLDVFTGWPTNAVKHFTAPAPMVAAGFLASPELVNDEQLLRFYGENKTIRPNAYSVDFDSGAENCWSERLGYRIYRIENALGPRAR